MFVWEALQSLVYAGFSMRLRALSCGLPAFVVTTQSVASHPDRCCSASKQAEHPVTDCQAEALKFVCLQRSGCSGIQLFPVCLQGEDCVQSWAVVCEEHPDISTFVFLDEKGLQRHVIL